MANEIVKSKATTISAYLVKNRSAIQAAMPKGANYERFCRTVINAISTTPAIAECTVDSLFLSCVKAFSVGIEPNGPTQEGYLVPFRDKGTPKAQFMPSYRGLISLARRSGMVSLVYADTIREGDKYKISRGTDPKLEHEPSFERGKPLAYYAVAKMSDGSMDFEVMTLSEIASIRKRSKAANAGPWMTDEEEMSKKTVLKRLVKRLPMSVENLAFAQAVQADNRAESGEDDVIDIEGIELPPAKESPFESAAKIESGNPAPAATPTAPNIEAATQSDADKLRAMFAAAPFVSIETVNEYLRKNHGMPYTKDCIENPTFRARLLADFNGIANAAVDWKAAELESKNQEGK